VSIAARAFLITFSAFLLLIPAAAAAEPASAQLFATRATAQLFATRATALDGKAITLEGYKGKALIVNFWARWCGPCRKELPDLAALYEKYRDKGLIVLGVALEDADYRTSVSEFAAAYGVGYPVVLVGASSGVGLMRSLGNDKGGVPFTLTIAPDGRILTKKLGAMNAEEMESAAAALFGQPASRSALRN